VTTYLVSFLIAFLAAVLLTPAMIRIATRLGAFDDSAASHRKIHAGDIPRLGGIAIVLSVYTPIVGLSVYNTRVGDAVLGDPQLTLGLLGGGLLIPALGMYDDLREASPKLKFAVQIGAALWVASMGFRIDRIDLPFLPMFDLGLLSIPVTVFWIVGITNAVNLIDGLDGLAAGMALFGIAPMMVLAISKGNLVLALICCCLAGAVLGFLVFNFHPARIFMGDTGSMFLGFVLAVVTVATSHKGRVAVAMLTPVLALGLPILDTLLAIARRAWFGQSLFVGDRQHIHHRLLASGHSHRGAVLVMYGFASVFALLGLAVHFNRDQESALLFGLSLLVAGVLLRKVGYLAMPTTVGGEIGAAAAIRARNKLVGQAIPRMQEQLAYAADVEAACAHASVLAWTAGADSATLELHDAGPAQPTRTWHWREPTTGTDLMQQCFVLRTTDRRTVGVLRVRWSQPAYHDAVLPRLEAGCADIADRLAALLDARVEVEVGTASK
jgi:UDP-GlcNAc:undecaprenyl-phosphate GlcNAc-1-phosphate transferase